MSSPELLLAFLASLSVGVVSAIMGLGGGLFLVPLLTLIPAISLDAARGTSLVCTLATSAAGSVALDRTRLADFETILILEFAAGLGAILGAGVLAHYLPPVLIYGGFALLVGAAAVRMARGGRARAASATEGESLAGEAPAIEAPAIEAPAIKAPIGSEPKLESDPASESEAPIAPLSEPLASLSPARLVWGSVGFVVAGIASAVLGIGGSPIKIPVQTEVCKIPLRVALANSNIMVGITAGVGAAVYFGAGDLALALVAPCALGISLGAYLGGRIAPRLPTHRLRGAFTLILTLVAGRMLWKAWTE